MCKNHLVKYLAKEKGVSIEEAKREYEARKKFRKYFKEVKVNENYRTAK